MPEHRELVRILDRVVHQIPASECALFIAFSSLRAAAIYCPQQALDHIRQAALLTLAAAFETPRNEWQLRVVDIWTGRK